jgi:thiol-disulfide isomerase/thioredoxin
MSMATATPAGAVGAARRLAGGLLLSLGVALAGCGGEPEVRLADGTGTGWDAWEGRWLVINYWAEWCAPCREEIPELNRLHAEGDRYGLVVLGVNYDGLQGEALTGVMERMDVAFPVLAEDPRSRWGLPLPSILPSTVIVDPEGEVHEVLVGPQTEESLLHAMGMTSEA